ncbi:MAG: AAA family ATPase [Desulfobacca sp.]|uniref:AAA family ATPase n=1 Tax=Desulfobacca sp. TaxID=2067990 RepID=UPI004049985B
MKPVRAISPVAASAAGGDAGQLQKTPRIIAVTSGRRGVGQSVVVVLLGLALSRLGKRVLLLDAALGQASLHTLLGIRPRLGLADVLAGRRALTEVMIKGPGGLEILPAAVGETAAADLSQEAKILFLQELEGCTANFDLLLVDTGAGLGQHVLYFNMGAQERLVVVDEEPASIIDAYTLIKVLATQYAARRFQVLFTRIAAPPVAHRAFAQLVKVADRFLHGTVSLDFLGIIPFDVVIVEAALRQLPLAEVAVLSPAGCAATRLAQALLVQEASPSMDGSMKFFWQDLHKRAASAFCQGASHEGQLR